MFYGPIKTKINNYCVSLFTEKIGEGPELQLGSSHTGETRRLLWSFQLSSLITFFFLGIYLRISVISLEACKLIYSIFLRATHFVSNRARRVKSRRECHVALCVVCARLRSFLQVQFCLLSAESGWCHT